MNPKQYLWQKMSKTYVEPTTLGNFDDAGRHYRDRHLTNAQIKVKINEQLQRERANKAMNTNRTDEQIQHAWSKFLNSKLITKPYFK